MRVEEPRTRVVLLCGGRGGTAISQHLRHRPDVHTSLVINGYDDGLSTGALRRMIPGLLGPSDFRKAFASLLDPASPRERALRTLLVERLVGSEGAVVATALRDFACRRDVENLPGRLAAALLALDVRCRDLVGDGLAAYFRHVDRLGLSVDYSDFALGNLLIAGMYLRAGDFNLTIRSLAELCPLPTDVLDVSVGECRWLAALKADGTVLADESEIVAPQSPSPIVGLYLLGRPVSGQERQLVERGSQQEKHAWLAARTLPAVPSPEASDAISRAEVLVYAPGTQHSSLFPSYRVAAGALKATRAAVKALVVNLDPDHDIQGLSPLDLVERALSFLEDPENRTPAITHVLCDPTATLPGGQAVEWLSERCVEYGIRVVPGPYRDLASPQRHCGRTLVDTLLALRAERAGRRLRSPGPARARVSDPTRAVGSMRIEAGTT